jgi:predicted acetyltransferase
MASRTVYDVMPHDDGWQVKRRGAEKASSLHDTKIPAIEAGIEVARNNEPSQLVIHKAGGTIEQERTYGNDPFPPRG